VNEHTHAEPGKKQPSVTSGILQRKCDMCKKKRPLQRKTTQEKTLEVPPIAHDVLPSPGQPLDPATRAFTEPGLRHDFSRIPLHPPVPGAVQTKLAINAPGDKYEQEADRIADLVMAKPAHNAIGCAPQHIQHFVGQPGGQMKAPASAGRILASPGRPMPAALRQEMEGRFGYDFSGVRVHTGGAAEESARDVNAHAYTLGRNIVFGAGEYAPRTAEGRRLLAHELTHSLQQSGSEGLMQRRLLTKAERKKDAKDLKEAKRRTRLLRRWLDGISKKKLDDIKPIRPNVRRANWVKLLESAKESGFDSLNTEEKKRLDKLTEDRQPFEIEPSESQGSEDATVEEEKEEKGDGPSKEPDEAGQEEKDKTSEGEELENLELPNFTCDPKPITFDKLNKLQGTSGRHFGLTVFKKAPTKFSPSFDKSKKCTISILNEGKFELDPFVFVQPGTYRYATDTKTDPKCPDKTLELHVKVTPDMAEKIKQGEIEHCEDYKRAFALSTAKYNRAMRDVKAEGKFSAKDRKTCADKIKERVFSKLGISSDKYDAVRNCLRKKSLERDTKGWHTVNVSATVDRVVDKKCTKIIFELDPNHKDMLPELGKHPTKDLIKDCGE
jgi:hypothetical protein